MTIENIQPQLFWLLDSTISWRKVDFEITQNPLMVQDIVINLGYSFQPDIVYTNEEDYLAVFEHKCKDEYLFHMQISGFSKLLFAEGLPAMIYLLTDLNQVMKAHMETVKLFKK